MVFVPKHGEIVAPDDLAIVDYDRRVRGDQVEVNVGLVWHRLDLLAVRAEPDMHSRVTLVDVGIQPNESLDSHVCPEAEFSDAVGVLTLEEPTEQPPNSSIAARIAPDSAFFDLDGHGVIGEAGVGRGEGREIESAISDEDAVDVCRKGAHLALEGGRERRPRATLLDC